MKDFWLNDYSGRHERWALDGHRWVSLPNPEETGLTFGGYRDNAAEVVPLGSGTHEEELEKLADQFLNSF